MAFGAMLPEDVKEKTMKLGYWQSMTGKTQQLSLRDSARHFDTANLAGTKGSSGDGGTVF